MSRSEHSQISIRSQRIALLLSLLALVVYASGSLAQAKLYRYINNKGVVVIDYSIPSEYVSKGYEVLNNQGQVIEKIEPEPTGAELAERERQRDILYTYERLKLRYSNVEDIERAKQRKIENLETNIAILNGNISGLNSNMETLISQAAKQERLGRAVPKTLLKKMDDLKAELKVAKDLLKTREKESQDIVERYDEDIEDFEAGQSLMLEVTQNP